MYPIIVALDGVEKEAALALAETCTGRVWGVKLHELLLRHNMRDLITEFKRFGKVFVDLKFHDIPEKVRQEVAALASFGTDLITVHASGGETMLKAAVEAGSERIAAVTLLTSLSPTESDLIYQITPDEAVQKFTRIAVNAGVRNIVCSPQEIAIVREIAPEARIIVPGIRGASDKKHDQKRTMSAKDAISAGADLLVIGRPITLSPDPRQALDAILSSLEPKS